MQIPQSYILTTKYLNRVFDKTVATYKYYWFLGILDLCVKHGKTRMNVWGVPTVAIGIYLRVLYALQLDDDILLLAKEDVIGKALQDLNLKKRERASQK